VEANPTLPVPFNNVEFKAFDDVPDNDPLIVREPSMLTLPDTLNEPVIVG